MLTFEEIYRLLSNVNKHLIEEVITTFFQRENDKTFLKILRSIPDFITDSQIKRLSKELNTIEDTSPEMALEDSINKLSQAEFRLLIGYDCDEYLSKKFPNVNLDKYAAKLKRFLISLDIVNIKVLSLDDETKLKFHSLR